METLSIFDLLPDEEAKKYKPIKSTDWKWTMAEDYPKEKNGLKVFSCFACGGGSTMGYKLAGCDVIGCCEIDPKMNEVYVKNHHPKHNFLSQTFPSDYDFSPNTEGNVGYICGMSVPPIMIKRIVTRLIESGLFDYKLRKGE